MNVLRMMLVLAVFCSFLAAEVSQAEAPAADFKGKDDPSEIAVGALMGMGILDNRVGFALLPTVSKKIVNRGFVPEIANSVSVEAEGGPLFLSGGTAFAYSLHLRWDFVKDDRWVFYALGGLGGDITGVSMGERFELYPRFGAGTMCRLAPNLALRAELSHELIGIGVGFVL